MARAKKKQQEETVQETVVQDEVVQDEILVVNEETSEVPETVVAETIVDETLPEVDMSQEDIRLVEAMLFATSAALSVSQIAERFSEGRAGVIPAVLEHLKEQYANRGVNLVQRNERWALRTATDLGDQLRLEKEQPKKFTRSAMETMAIIAYHQPVTRAEIENIRGVATAPGAVDALMEAGWIKPGKRREVPGRPVTWLSTQAFLDHFGLEKLEDLPGMDELKAAGLLDKRPAIEAMPGPDLFDEDGKNEVDPQEVTDEDLVGQVTEDGESAATMTADEGRGDEDDSDDEESEDEESEEESGEDEDDEDSDDEDSDDEESDDEDLDDEEESDEDDEEEK